MSQTVSQRDWEEWAHHPVTKLWQSQMREDLEEMQKLWMRGGYTRANGDESLQANAEAIGAAQTVQSMIDKIDELRAAAAEREKSNDTSN